MRFLQHLLAVVSLSLFAATAGATAASPVSGSDYRTLDKALQTDSGKKVEVTEFFWYACPHCNAFDPALTEWVKKQGDNIVFKRVPVAFRDSFIPQQKLYYTLEAMGKLDELHSKIFRTIHVERKSLDTESQITDYIVKQGVDKKKFLDTFNSFGVQTKVRRVASLQEAYHIDGVPLIAVGGRYVTSPSIVGTAMGNNQSETVLQTATLQVMDALVAKAAKEIKADAGSAVKMAQLSTEASKKK